MHGLKDLLRQVEVKRTEKDSELASIAQIDREVEATRQAFSTELQEIAGMSTLIEQQRGDCGCVAI